MKKEYREKRISKWNKFLKGFAIGFTIFVLVFGGYMVLGHKDSDFQKWLTDVKSNFETIVEDNVESK